MKWPSCLRLLLLGCFLLGILPEAPAEPKTVTILHTNDMHASFVPHEATWVKEPVKPLVGGFKELSFAVDSMTRVSGTTLLLDAGDVMTGNPITEREYKGALGGALFEMMNMIGYDAWCPGNHDFDISQDNLRALTRVARFPTLSANIVDDAGMFAVCNKPYAILEKGGMRIGIIGVMSQELYSLVNQNNLVGIRVLSPAETVQKYVDELRPQTDLLIALTHQGVDYDSLLALSVKGLDIIVGGHSHTRLKKPRIVNNILIVQAGSSCENLGFLRVRVDSHRVTAFEGGLIPLWVRPHHPATPLTRLIDSIDTEIDEDYSAVIGTLKDDWIRNDSVSAIGTFITEAQREAAGAEVAFTNNYGIRRDVSAGPLTKKALFEVLPFRNILTTFQLSGRQLKSILVHRIETKAAIQITGLSCRWKRRADGTIEFIRINVQRKPLDERRMYVCAASDYFVGEAKRYLGLEVTKPIYLRQTVFEAVERAVKKAKIIHARTPYRIEEERDK